MTNDDWRELKMDQAWVREYVEKYLELHQCEVIDKNSGYTQVKLSVDVDKDLTNRPYYWTFVERTGTEPETLTLNFIFDSEQTDKTIRGEEIRFGSERLKQIFHSAKNRGRMVRLYQQYHHLKNNKKHSPAVQPLSPWLGVNYKVEFLSDQKKDKLISVGMNLATGEMKENFYEMLRNINLGPVLPPNVSTIPSFLNIREATLQLEEWILHEIKKEDFDWVYKANERLKEEINQLEAYYLIEEIQTEENDEEKKQETEAKLVEKESRIDEAKWQYSPRVEVKPINFGLFYLDQLVLKNVEYIHSYQHIH